MSYMTKEAINQRLQEHYEIAEQTGKTIFGIFLQGSQNYIDDLFFEGSDVDSRVIYIPNTREICLGKDISEPELILDNGEHIDQFDIRKFLKLILTPGINNYECLFTEYAIVNPVYKDFYDNIVNIREKLVRMNEKNFLMSCMGISMRDYKMLTRRTGGEDWDIENLGYSRKRLSNILRLNKTIKLYMMGESFHNCLKAMPQEEIYKVRRTIAYSENEALELADKVNQESKKLAEAYHYTKNDDIIKEEIQEIIVGIMERSMKLEIAKL